MKKNFKISLGLKFSLIILLMSLLIGSLVLVFSYQEYTRQIVDHYVRASEDLVETVAPVVDWDKIDHYYETGETDKAYDETLENLKLLARAGDARYVYVFKPVEDKGLVFIFDTDEAEDALALGEAVGWEEEAEGVKETSLAGEPFTEPIIADDEGYGWLLTTYTPFFDSAGKFVGYLGIDYGAGQLVEEQDQFVRQLACVTIVLALLITLAAIPVLRKILINPVKQIAEATDSYLAGTEDSLNTRGSSLEKNSITELTIATGDELYSLSKSLKNMERKIQSYFKNLEEATRRAETDSMTGLLNREAFYRRVDQILQDEAVEPYAVFMMIDLDDFKNVNDTYGHLIGDEVILECTKAIKECFRPEDFIVRMGGDEFAVFFKSSGTLDEIEERIKEVVAAVRNVVVREKVSITASVGAAIVPAGADYGSQKLYLMADDALYEAKDQGRDRYVITVV